jgi:hypothetical protein
VAQISIKVRNTRIRTDGFGKKLRGQIVIALLSFDHAQQVKRVRMLWVDL